MYIENILLLIILQVIPKRGAIRLKKRERVIAAINGRPVDCVPSGFTLHFPADSLEGEAAVAAHLDFFRETDTDIIKIMNENLYPSMGTIKAPEDFYKYRIPGPEDGFIEKQTALTKAILSEADPECFSLGTVRGITPSMIHPLMADGMTYEEARLFVRDSLRENPEPVLWAARQVTEALCRLARGYIEAGADGVYYAALGGERDIFTDREFELWVKPFEIEVLKAIREAGGYCFLHICKENLNMERYRSYGPYIDVVNWGVYEAPLSLSEGQNLFPGKTIMGGLANHQGVIDCGTEAQLRAEVKSIIRTAGKEGFILGADCTLPAEISYRQIRAAVDAARERGGYI